jgi:quercetin dioxygenase-like cupin family protein
MKLTTIFTNPNQYFKRIATAHRMPPRLKLAPIAALGGLALLVGATFALTTTRLASGTIASSRLFNGPATVVTSRTTMEPGDTIPWHYHPGVVYVTVTKGALTKYDPCGPTEVYSAGAAFEEGASVHQVINRGTEQAEFYATVIVPAGQPNRIDVSEPHCQEFDVCLRDDQSGDNFQFNSFTGNYQFIPAGAGSPTLSGKGQLRRVGCTLTLQNAQVFASLTTCPLFGPPRGSASIKITPSGSPTAINDSNTTAHTCALR